MKNISIIINCDKCSTRNRVRIPKDKNIRIRCGKCGNTINVSRESLRSIYRRKWLMYFFSDGIPNLLYQLVNYLFAVLGVFIKPILAVWSKFPPNFRKKASWIFISLLTIAYLFSEGTLRAFTFIVLILIMVVAAVVMVSAARGPDTAAKLINKLIKTCPSCGHRHLPLLKTCPKCGYIYNDR